MSIITAIIGTVQGGGSPPPPPSPSYDANWTGSFDEGSYASLNVIVNNFPGGRVWWKVEGYGGTPINTSSDIDSGQLSGFYDFGSVTYSSQSVTTIYWKADNLTENYEYFYVKLGTNDGGSEYGTYGPWVINDTSTTPAPTATLTMAASVNEGATLTATVATTNVADGTTMYWWKKSGTADISDVTLSGTFTITGNAGSFEFTPRADGLTEGSESLNISIGLQNGTEMHWAGTNIVDTSTLGTTFRALQTFTVPSPAVSGAAWNTQNDSGTHYDSIVGGPWTRSSALLGGVTLTGSDTYIIVPTPVQNTSFSVTMIANFTDVGGWQSLWDTGSMNEGGTGYTCYYNGGYIAIATDYGLGSAGVSLFNATGLYEGAAHWAFVVDVTSSTDNCQIYRNGTALTKVTSTARTPTTYGNDGNGHALPLMVGARRGVNYNRTDYLQGTIHKMLTHSVALTSGNVTTEYQSLRTGYGYALTGQPNYNYTGDDPVTGQAGVWSTGQFASASYNIVQVGWKAVAVGGSQAGWEGTITAVNENGAGWLRVAHNNPGGVWPQDATSFRLVPF